MREAIAAAAVICLFGFGAATRSQGAVDDVSRETDSFLAVTHLNPASPEAFSAACDAYLARAAALKRGLERETGPARVESSLRAFDALQNVLAAAQGDSDLVSQTNLSPAARDAARACAERVYALHTEINLSRPIYDRLRAIDASDADPTTRYLLARALAQYERAGVGASTLIRGRLRELQDRISRNSIAFERNIAEGRKQVVATPAELEGLPADYIAAHRPGADGRITISTDYPDYGPVMSYARSEALRRRLHEANLTRAYPDNDALLRQILADRQTLAGLLGRPNFATLVTEDKMIGSPANAANFLDEINRVAEAPAQRDLALMLGRLRRIEPAATSVPIWSTSYLSQLIRKEQFEVDPQEVRRYFSYDNVREGIFRLTRDLFGVEIRRWETPLWAPGVESYEMYEDGRLIGRFYMDNHPRPGKYTHANVIPVRYGLADRAVPVGILVCNLPGGDQLSGLMEHRDVETFLHEFGHLLHLVFSGRQQWTLASMGNLEWDFIEAPSQMLENWVWDYETLRRFAVNSEGEPIPEALVARMNRARGFAEAFGDKHQLANAAVSLAYHLRAPGDADLTEIYRAVYNRYSAVPMPEGRHPQASFGHLTGYSAIVYTYMWSKAISTDLMTRFERGGLRDAATSRRYRELVLAPGSSKPAATLVSDFLGRPLSLEAYRARLTRPQ